MNTSYDGENITVAVRLRPMIEKEIQARYWPRWETNENTVCEIDGKRTFAFDRVFSPESSTEEIHEALGENIVFNCMEGFNGCMFCYGQTGSGKTYTMYGNKNSPGIVPLCVETIFAFIQETPDREFLVRCSYLEVYNESINDLLNPDAENLVIQEDKKNGIQIYGLTEEICTSLNQVNSYLYIGETNKQFAATNMNMKSSRSHCIFKLNIEAVSRGEDTDMSYGTLFLVDLAGSEAANVHNLAEVSRTQEMKYINRSLLTLGTIIMRLGDSTNTAPIPYRDSKLTRILRNALEGQSKVVIICNITASSFVFEETLSTLKFAIRAKNIKQHAKKNEIVDDKMMIRKYENEIKALQAKLREMEEMLNKSQKGRSSENEINKVRAELDSVVTEKNELGSKLDDTIQEKVKIENELQRLQSKILVSENVSFNSIEVGLWESKSQSRRRNRVSMHRESGLVRGRFQSEVVDLKTVEKIRKIANEAVEIPQAPKKIKTREELIIQKIEELTEKHQIDGSNLWKFSVMLTANEITEAGEEKIQNKIEEYENYIQTLINQLTRKDEEIEMLKDELDLCRGNFNRLQKLLHNNA